MSLVSVFLSRMIPLEKWISTLSLGRRHAAYLLCAVVGCPIVYRVLFYPRFFSPLRHVPGPPLGEPIIGACAPIFARDARSPAARDWVKKYGPVVRNVGPIGIERLYLVSPEHLHQVLVREWTDYERPEYLQQILGLVAGHGLLTTTGKEHRDMRKAMNPAFSLVGLAGQLCLYYEHIETLVRIFDDFIGDAEGGTVLPTYEWLSKVTLDIIAETAFGYKTESLRNPDNELATAFGNMMDLQNGPNLFRVVTFMSIPGAARFVASDWAYEHRRWFSRIPFLGPAETLIESTYKIRRIAEEILQERMREAAAVVASDSEKAARRDLMSILVRARQADLEKDDTLYAMSDQAMVDQVLTFLGAGHETTASGLAWTLWLLATDQESQQKLRDEVTPILTANPRPDYKTLKDLQWLDCVVMESLRVLPPVPLTVRKAYKTGLIGDFLVPKGTFLHIPIRVINTWTDIWGPDAEEFRPSRWLDSPKSYNPTFSLMSFIAGPHGCIGKTMALLEMKAVLAHLIAAFHFEPAYEGQKISPAAAITMKPTDGMPLRIKRVRRN
ncbi:cytochrome P450 [Schizophyllum commune H4-8]|uniref:cytochrome P450 n=1 Tax=Schizophyllum commune (strain H4-8 / FGSC 9210) TaxID=578458 RepID=UPI00215F6D51|nr:cytochrome P450 [Schizophyllum commune H4-8]KAI5891748.1 cytochrome P450 [Schizophyllum commune H4-8]